MDVFISYKILRCTGVCLPLFLCAMLTDAKEHTLGESACAHTISHSSITKERVLSLLCEAFSS